MTESAPLASKIFSPAIVQRPAFATRVGDFVESIFGVAEDADEVVIGCRLNPDDLWTFTPCLFARVNRNDLTKPQWKRIE